MSRKISMKADGILWNTGFQLEKNKRFSMAQKVVDSEVIRRTDPYVPFRTGQLKHSGISGTVIGSGEIRYTAPYAKRQYYENAGRGIEGLHASGGITGKRGRLFFERMKADQKQDILKAAKECFQ